MRRISRVTRALSALMVVGAALLPAVPASAGGDGADGGTGRRAVPADDARRGLVHRDLRPGRPGGPCASGFELGAEGSGRCTHGPDPAPPGVDVRRERPVAELAAAARVAEEQAAVTVGEPGAGSLLCLDDGVSGNRVQAVYAVASDRADRFAQVSPFLPVWAEAADRAFNASAAETGGTRHVRWVTNPDCTLSIQRVVLSPTGDDSLDNTETELIARGFNRRDRKYLVWTDSTVYCGIGGVYEDDRPGQDNANNGVARAPALFSRVDSGCWGRTASVEAHELMHNIGGVQPSAPHATPGFHCTDESDRMCYEDDPATVVTPGVCPASHETLFDCNHDDYFSTTPPPAGSYLATHWNTADSTFLTSLDLAAANDARYNPLSPARILDTRVGTGAPAAKLGPVSRIDLQVTGQGGVPATGVSAVVLNVTALAPTSASFLTAWPTGLARPLASNLNYVPGQVVPNLVKVKVGFGGKVSLYNHAGSTDVAADVAGWYGDATATTGARYTALPPVRILDTRFGTGAPAAKIGAAATLALQVTGQAGVPASGVSAVVLNVTALDATVPSFLTAWPAGDPRPLASNLNYVAGQIVPNLVTVKVGPDGRVNLYNHAGAVHVAADVAGWYGDATATIGARYTAVTPARILDTRVGTGAGNAKVGPATSIDLLVAGQGGVPASGVSAVVLNVTALEPTADSFLTVWPAGQARPLASNLNYVFGQTVPNLVVVKVGANGRVSLYNHAGAAHVAADVAGWFNAE